MTAAAVDYEMTRSQVDALRSLLTLPAQARRDAISAYCRDHSRVAVYDLFAQFIGMANAVVANNREMIEQYLICDKGEYPHSASKINLPTILGACKGVTLAAKTKCTKPCDSCAFRVGTPANQSDITTSDAEHAMDNGKEFWCHESEDERGNCQAVCRGYLGVKKP